MNSIEKLQKDMEIGQPIFEQFFKLSDIELKEKLKSVSYDNEYVCSIVNNNCNIKRIILNEESSEIILSFYDGIKIDWQGIHYQPEHGSGRLFVKFGEHFKF